MDMCTRYFYARILTIVWCVYAPVVTRMVTVTAVLRSRMPMPMRGCPGATRGPAAIVLCVPVYRRFAVAPVRPAVTCVVSRTRADSCPLCLAVCSACVRARIAMVLDRL